MSEEAQPAKRRPGRPRKAVVAPMAESDAGVSAADSDPRIGQQCDPGWSSVGYGDGATYRCENGKIVERVI